MLDHSREFIELAMRLNYTTAAEHLHVSVSALSRHIADLEAELGFSLLKRNPIELTPAGLFYLESISSIIDDLDNTIEKGREIASEASKRLSIYMLPSKTVFADVVYEAAARLRRRHPGLATELCVDDRFFTTEEALLNGRADVGVVYEYSITNTAAIVTVPFATAELCAWVRPTNPLASKEAITLADLEPYWRPVSTNRQSLTASESTSRLFEANGLRPRTRLRNLEARDGFYLTLREDEFVLDFTEDAEPGRVNPDLVQLPFEGGFIRPLSLAYLRGSENKLVGQFVKECRSIALERNIASNQTDSE